MLATRERNSTAFRSILASIIIFSLFGGLAFAYVQSVSLIFPANNSWTNNQTIYFVFVPNTNTTLVNATLWGDWNAGTWSAKVLNITELQNSTSNTITADINSGTWVWNVEVWDDSNSGFNASNYTINIDRADPNTALITYPTAGLNLSGTIVITASASDVNSGVQKVEFYNDTTLLGTNSTFNLSSYTFSWVTTAADDGVKSLLVRVYDAASNCNFSSTVNITVDNTAPTIVLYVPQNTTYTAKNVSLNVSANESVNTWWYSLDSSANVTFTPNTTLTNLSEGQHNITVYANDSANNIGSGISGVRYFTVHAVGPTINISSPANNATFNTISVTFVVNIDDSQSGVSYHLLEIDSINYSIPWIISDIYSLTNSSMTQGNHTYRVYANDTLGNMNVSETRTLKIDTAPPTITFVSPTPTNNSIISTINVTINVSINDTYSSISNCLLELDGVNYPMTKTGSGTSVYCNYINNMMTNALHNVTVYANDTLNNTNFSSIKFRVNDSTPPTITIISPKNNTIYANNSISLNYSVSENVSWIGYSLDGIANVSLSNVTLTGNITLENLTESQHNITVYANDTIGNMNFSRVYFTVDANAPTIIIIIFPANTTYQIGTIALNYTVSEATLWEGYSLDGTANVTLTGNATLYLLNGAHNITVYANDTLGNMNSSAMVYFTVNDTTLPTITITSPKNATYSNNTISIDYSVSENTSNVSYSINGTLNGTLTGNTTLTFSNGSNSITIYAQDIAGNIGNATAYFTVTPNATLTVTIFSPTNTTYSTSSVTLSYSVSEATLWEGYSLDGAANVTLTGNTTLTGLSNGQHNVIVYANDTLSDTNSARVYFTVSVSSGSTGGGGGGGQQQQQTIQVTTGYKQATITIPSLSAGSSATIDIPESSNLDITRVIIDPAAAITSGSVTINKLASKPATITSEIEGKVYSYSSVQTTNIPTTSINSVTIRFKVEKSWVSSNNISQNSVALYRHTGTGTWNKLTTTKTSDDSTYYYYLADSPGFSTFGISGTVLTSAVTTTAPPSTTRPPTMTPPPIVETTPSTTTVPPTVPPQNETTNETPTVSTATPPSKTSPVLFLAWAGGIIEIAGKIASSPSARFILNILVTIIVVVSVLFILSYVAFGRGRKEY